MQVAHESTPTLQLISVDVRLCGSIPRNDMKRLAAAPCSLKDCLTSPRSRNFTPVNGSGEASTLRNSLVCDALNSLVDQSSMRGVLTEKQPLTQVLEPPNWAVPAQGETRLEPVCEALGRQTAVDLTTRACFRVGRSPNSDVQLHHATSSRRHAMIFHHSNGSCYIVDSGSAYGTFVNGVRVAAPGGGLVVPHKVKNGAIIRFGGPGAPTFLLKSFAFHLHELESESDPDMGELELVRRNTRLNALGRTAQESFRETVTMTIQRALSVTRKRSYDSLDSRDTWEEEPIKRMRCSSPPLSPQSPLRLVSPDIPMIATKKSLRVTFSSEPPQVFFPALVTPEEPHDF